MVCASFNVKNLIIKSIDVIHLDSTLLVLKDRTKFSDAVSLSHKYINHCHANMMSAKTTAINTVFYNIIIFIAVYSNH